MIAVRRLDCIWSVYVDLLRRQNRIPCKLGGVPLLRCGNRVLGSVRSTHVNGCETAHYKISLKHYEKVIDRQESIPVIPRGRRIMLNFIGR